MIINNFLYSDFNFNEDENLLKFKFRMINLTLAIAAFFSTLFGIMSDLGINDLGPIHSKVNYLYAISSLFILFFLRRSKENYTKAANALLIASLLTFTSALILVPQDEFRMIWFYLLIYIAYILSGTAKGMFFTLISIAIILLTHFLSDLQLSQTAINSGVLGLLIGSFLSHVYTDKVTAYELSLREKNSSLNILASTDGLTGIMNKRIFNEVSQRYFDTAQRKDEDLSLLLFDLDFFKKVNDTYGHGVGDLLLIRFVQTTQLLLRKSDIFARIGGEEFAILLFNTDGSGALNLAEKIRREVEKMSILYEDQEIRVTTSIGLSKNKNTDTSFDEIFSRSDKALYQAKEQGRNRTAVIN